MTRRRKRKLAAGDVFDIAHRHGLHGAVVVLGTFGRVVAFGVTEYFGDEVARGDEAELRRVFRRTGGVWEDDFDVHYCDPTPPPGAYIGRVELSDDVPLDEEADACGPWIERYGELPYVSHLWRTDRKLAEQEWLEPRLAAEKKRDAERRKKGPGRLLSDEVFWRLIGDGETWVVEPDAAEAGCIARLAKCSPKQIALFEKTLTYKLYLLDTRAHADAHADGWPVSSDMFLYGRCGVVASGPELYETVLEDPSWFPPEADAEALLSVATTAYQQVTGEELDPDTTYCYETGSNVEGWA